MTILSAATAALGLVSAGQAPEANPVHLLQDGVALSITAHTSGMCEVQPAPLFERMTDSFSAHGLEFRRAQDDETSLIAITVRTYGQTDYGCGAYMHVEFMQHVEAVAVDYAQAPYEGQVTLASFMTPYPQSGLEGEDFQAGLGDWAREELTGLWGQMMELQAQD
ncbi:hypothetical protein F1654_05205 [Alkalicaulis satelles]|uniref:Uncharacterized protein n=1 Tax=Alkalicaulis satelles TaxID=2609175 RepID=A0A5M6ZQ47_9PROT|nr:hypothetical protein [Alkalicaulis satelles]KAA5805378.1 hypothetical protein F1654_05205 [Alkalicaulis satelles]